MDRRRKKAGHGVELKGIGQAGTEAHDAEMHGHGAGMDLHCTFTDVAQEMM